MFYLLNLLSSERGVWNIPTSFFINKFLLYFFLKVVCVCMIGAHPEVHALTFKVSAEFLQLQVLRWAAGLQSVHPASLESVPVLHSAAPPSSPWSPLSCLWLNEFHYFRSLICVQSFMKYLSF